MSFLGFYRSAGQFNGMGIMLLADKTASSA